MDTSWRRCAALLAVGLALLAATDCLACSGCTRGHLQSERPFDGFYIHILSLWMTTMLVCWLDAEQANTRTKWRACVAGAFVAAVRFPWNLLGLAWIVYHLIRRPSPHDDRANSVLIALITWFCVSFMWSMVAQHAWQGQTNEPLSYLLPNFFLSAVCFCAIAAYSVVQIRRRDGWLWRPLLAILALSLFWLSDLRDGLAIAMFYSRGNADRMLYDLHVAGLGFLIWLPAVTGCYLILPEIAARRWRGAISVLTLAGASTGVLCLAFYLDRGQVAS